MLRVHGQRGAPREPEPSRATVTRRGLTRRMSYTPGLPPSLIEALDADADGLVARGRPLKQGGRCTVSHIESRMFPCVVKRYNLRGPLHTAGHFFLPSRARRNWRFGRLLLAGGIATPRPLACLEQCIGPLRFRSFLLTEYIPARTFWDLLYQRSISRRQLSELIEQFLVIWRRLGELRLSHGDLNLSNFLVAEDGRMWLIDLDGIRRHRSELALRWARERDWRTFMREWRKTPYADLDLRRAA